MAFGINLLNAHGDEIVDFNLALYKKATGTLKHHDAVLSQSQQAAWDAGYGNDWWQRRIVQRAYPYSSTYFEPNRRYTTTAGAASPLDGSRIMLHPALVASASDLIFVRPQAAGFWRFVTFNFDGALTLQTPTGSFAEVFADQDLEYMVASPDEDGPAPSGTHGIQLKDPSGKVTFDSRYPQVAIVHTVVVPKSILEEILLSTRSSYDITLPKPVPNCWVSCPYHCSFAQTSGGTNFVKVHQLNSTTIRLSKQGNGTGTAYAKFFTQDLILFFARTA